jgi:hypothetical protein
MPMPLEWPQVSGEACLSPLRTSRQEGGGEVFKGHGHQWPRQEALSSIREMAPVGRRLLAPSTVVAGLSGVGFLSPKVNLKRVNVNHWVCSRVAKAKQGQEFINVH